MNEKELMVAAIPLAEIKIIKRDLDLLRKLSTNISPILKLQMVPYSALLCYEALMYLKTHGSDINLEQTSRYSLKEIRQKAKFFEFRINKLIQSINNVDKMQNKYFVELMKYPQYDYWNVHTNIGIYYDEKKHIVGNTHFAYYLFQDENSISKPEAEMNNLEIEREELRAFGYDMGVIIGNVSSGLDVISDFVESDVLKICQSILSQDFNTNSCMTTGSEKYKLVRLFLLHVLSCIGFVLYGLKPMIIRDTGLLLRLEYITYHYTLKRADGILKYCKRFMENISDSKLIDMLESIDCSNKNKLRKKEFRNCMMHFGLKDEYDNCFISEKKLNLSVPFCGLVETQFDCSYSEYQSLIEKELCNLYDIINQYLGIDL